MSGQLAKNGSGSAAEHRPEPPNQFWNPDLIRAMPINMTVGPGPSRQRRVSCTITSSYSPVTIGGKMRSMTLGGRKERRISRKAQTEAVPMMAP